MQGVGRDFRFALRALLKKPALSAVALLSLALGIGANTAIFSLLNAVVLRPLPVPHPEQLVQLSTSIADTNYDQAFSWTMFQELSRRQEVFSEIFSWNGGGMNNFETNGWHFAASLATVSGNYYRGVETAPLLGRYIGPTDVATGNGVSSAVAVISFRAWHKWFHGAPNIIGQVIRVGSYPFTVIGVEPEGFSGLIIDGVSDITIPVFAPGSPATADRGNHQLQYAVFGRLKPGVSIAPARVSFEALWPRILEATPPADYTGERRTRYLSRKIKLTPAATGISYLRQRFSLPLRLLMGIVAALLFIACLNIANLSLAKAAAYRHQSGVQAALGATTWDLMRPPLIESLLLSFAGALLGLLLAYGASGLLLGIAWTGFVPTTLNAAPDLRVLGFTTGVTIATALLFGIVPALFAARTDPMDALKRTARSISGTANLFGRFLLITQVALSLVLVLAALLFGRTLSSLHEKDAGYSRDHLLTLQLFEQAGTKLPRDGIAYYRELADKVRSVPGVEAVSYSSMGPASGFEYKEQVFDSLSKSPVEAVHDAVTPDFFSLAGMHLLAGRDVSWSDAGRPQGTAVISQSLADRLFGGQYPLGRTLYIGPHAHARQVSIAGVVNSASLWKVESVRPLAIYTLYDPATDGDEPLMEIRTRLDPRAMKTATEQAVREFGHHYSLLTMTVDERLDSHTAIQRLTAMLSAFFGGVALLIACAGLYGLMSFHVTRRTAELGIRSALGAQRRNLLMLILREAMLLAVAGCGIGLVISLAAGRVVQSLLFGVTATDPAALAAAAGIMLAVAAMAGLLPARRAAGVDPMIALRAD